MQSSSTAALISLLKSKFQLRDTLVTCYNLELLDLFELSSCDPSAPNMDDLRKLLEEAVEVAQALELRLPRCC